MRRGRERVSTRVSSWLPALPTFSPLSLSPLAWLDASDTSTITASGSPSKVSQWNDKSSNGRNVSQGVSASQPITGQDSRNGRNVITYSGGQLLASAAFTRAQPITIGVVAAASSFPITNMQIVGNDVITPIIYASPTANRVWRTYAGTELVSAVTPDTNWHYFTATYNGSSSIFRLDGSQIAAGNVGTSGYANKRLLIGSDNGSTFWSGYIAEVAVFGALLTGAEIGALEAYFKNKWGF